jgi:hypothetical protein
MFFLEPLDMWVTNNVAGFSPAQLMSFTEQQQLFNDLKTLDLLRRELSAFLGKHALPTNFVDDDQQWFSFVNLYQQVVEDGTLSLYPKHEHQLEAVKCVTIQEPKPLYPGETAALRAR